MAALSACATVPAAPVVVLPNGYLLEPDKAAQCDLVQADGHHVLPASVAAYGVYGDLVTGAVGDGSGGSALYTVDHAFAGGSDTRYFILHTKTRKLESNLTAAEWRDRLDELGVPASFHIYPFAPRSPMQGD